MKTNGVATCSGSGTLLRVSIAIASFAWLGRASMPGSAPRDDTWVNGRIVEPKREGVASNRHERIHGWIFVSSDDGRGDRRETLDWPLDREGRFRAEIQEYRAQGDVSFWFELRDEHGGFESGFRIGLPEPGSFSDPNPEEYDLGNLEFPASKSIAKGRVVTTSGKPIADVHVTLEGDFHLGIHGVMEEKRVEGIELLQTFTRPDGSFDLVSPFPVRDCHLRFEADEYLDATCEIPAAGAVECRLAAEARIEGSIELDAAMRGELGKEGDGNGLSIQALVHAHDSLFQSGWGGSAPIDGKGNYRLAGLEAGEVDVRLVEDSNDGFEVVRWIPHVPLREGAAADDPRLRKLSFKRAPKIRLHILADAPKSVVRATDPDPDHDSEEDRGPFGSLVGVDADGTPTGWSRSFSKGEATIRPRADVRRIEVRVDGFRSAFVDDLAQDASIRLRPGIAVKVVLAPADLPCCFQAALVSTAERRRDIDRRVFIAFDTRCQSVRPVSDEPLADWPGLDPEKAERVVGTGQAEPAPPPDPDDHPGIFLFALNDPGSFEFALMNLHGGVVVPLPRETAVLEVKESADLQVFGIHLDPDVVRSLQKD